MPVALFSVYPLLQGIYLGFTDSRAGLNQVTHFTGLENYQDLLHNDLFWNSFKIGLIWAFSVTFLQFVAGDGPRPAAEPEPQAALAGPHPRRWCRGRCRRSSSRSCGG